MKNDLTPDQLQQPVTLTIPLGAVLRLATEQPAGTHDSVGLRVAFQQDVGPKIGSAYQGGVYAGLSLHEGKVVELVLLPKEASSLTWQQAGGWAKEQGGELPSRIDQLVLLQNLKGEFKDAYYWSCEPADAADWAWCQGFGDGTQYYDGKGYELRARAVRRLFI